MSCPGDARLCESYHELIGMVLPIHLVDAGGSPAWPEALAVVPPDAVDRSTSSEKELSGLWADVDSQVGSNQAAATVATDSDNIDQAVPPADIDNDLPEGIHPPSLASLMLVHPLLTFGRILLTSYF